MPGPGSAFSEDLSCPSPLVELNGAVYFFARDFTHGTELWRSDGTAAGTVLVADMAPGLDAVVTDTSAVDGGGRAPLVPGIHPGGRARAVDERRNGGGNDALRGHRARTLFVAPRPVPIGRPASLPLRGRRRARDGAVGAGPGAHAVGRGRHGRRGRWHARRGLVRRPALVADGPPGDGCVRDGRWLRSRRQRLTNPDRACSRSHPALRKHSRSTFPWWPISRTSPKRRSCCASVARPGRRRRRRWSRVDPRRRRPAAAGPGWSVQEGDAGQTPAVIGVSLVTKNGAPTTLPKTVQFATEPGSATRASTTCRPRGHSRSRPALRADRRRRWRSRWSATRSTSPTSCSNSASSPPAPCNRQQ